MQRCASRFSGESAWEGTVRQPSPLPDHFLSGSRWWRRRPAHGARRLLGCPNDASAMLSSVSPSLPLVPPVHATHFRGADIRARALCGRESCDGKRSEVALGGRSAAMRQSLGRTGRTLRQVEPPPPRIQLWWEEPYLNSAGANWWQEVGFWRPLAIVGAPWHGGIGRDEPPRTARLPPCQSLPQLRTGGAARCHGLRTTYARSEYALGEL